MALLSSLATLTVEISATSLRSVYLDDSDEIARVNLMQIVGGLWGAMPTQTYCPSVEVRAPICPRLQDVFEFGLQPLF